MLKMKIFWVCLFTPIISGVDLSSKYPLAKPTQALSSTYLKHLTGIEYKLIPILQSYSTHLEERIALIRKYVGDYRNQLSTTILPHRVGNPFANYRQLRRFATMGGPMLESIGKGAREESFLQELDHLITGLGYPGAGDVDNAMVALLRLQHTHSLNPVHLANGIVGGIQTGAKLESMHTMEIANFALSQDYHSLALSWLQVSRNSDPILVEEIAKSLMEQHDEDYETKREQGHMFLYSEPLSPLNLTTHQLLSKPYLLPKTISSLEMATPSISPYTSFAFCQGRNLQSDKIKKNMRCWLDSTRHPYFTIQPVRVEKLDHNLHIFHSFVGENGIQYLKNMVLPAIHKEKITIPHSRNHLGFDYAPDGDAQIKKLEQKLNFLTDLEMIGENMRVAVYASGAGMREHHDSFKDVSQFLNPGENTTEYAHRHSTFLLYLSDVAVGGGTVFPSLGLAVQPIKGAALYWEGYHPNSVDIDWTKYHGGCPVLLGTKWYATKWISKPANMFKRPCPVGYIPSIAG